MQSVDLEKSFQALGHDNKLKDKRVELYSDSRSSKEREEVNAMYLWSTSQYLQCNAGLVISWIPSTDEQRQKHFYVIRTSSLLSSWYHSSPANVSPCPPIPTTPPLNSLSTEEQREQRLAE
jgi:hypothetical protein